MDTGDLEEIDLNHEKIMDMTEVEPIGGRVKKLCLRQNRITKIEPLSCFPSLLELDLYDNGISKIENLEGCGLLRVLDLSFNRIRVVEGLGQLFHLETLYLASNKVQELALEEMAKLAELRVLEMGANEISVLGNSLAKNVNLEQLYLSRNHIRLIHGLDTLSNLRILALQNNQIERIEGLCQLRSLEELYLSNNRLQRIEGLGSNENLRVLDVANNMISLLDGVGHLTELQEFWANNNKIDSFEELRKLSPCTKIISVYFEGNSIASKSRYIAIVREYLPSLRQIDASIIKWE